MVFRGLPRPAGNFFSISTRMGNELCSSAKESAFEVVLKNTAGHARPTQPKQQNTEPERDRFQWRRDRFEETERDRVQWRRDRLERNAPAAQTAASSMTDAFAKVDSENLTRSPGLLLDAAESATALLSSPPQPKVAVGSQGQKMAAEDRAVAQQHAARVAAEEEAACPQLAARIAAEEAIRQQHAARIAAEEAAARKAAEEEAFRRTAAQQQVARVSAEEKAESGRLAGFLGPAGEQDGDASPTEAFPDCSEQSGKENCAAERRARFTSRPPSFPPGHSREQATPAADRTISRPPDDDGARPNVPKKGDCPGCGKGVYADQPRAFDNGAYHHEACLAAGPAEENRDASSTEAKQKAKSTAALIERGKKMPRKSNFTASFKEMLETNQLVEKNMSPRKDMHDFDDSSEEQLPVPCFFFRTSSEVQHA